MENIKETVVENVIDEAVENVIDLPVKELAIGAGVATIGIVIFVNRKKIKAYFAKKKAEKTEKDVNEVEAEYEVID